MDRGRRGPGAAASVATRTQRTWCSSPRRTRHLVGPKSPRGAGRASPGDAPIAPASGTLRRHDVDQSYLRRPQGFPCMRVSAARWAIWLSSPGSRLRIDARLPARMSSTHYRSTRPCAHRRTDSRERGPRRRMRRRRTDSDCVRSEDSNTGGSYPCHSLLPFLASRCRTPTRTEAPVSSVRMHYRNGDRCRR